MSLLKIVLSMTILSTYEYYGGVQCLTDKNLDDYDRHRHYDVIQFLKFERDHFDLHNRQCFLAALVYQYKDMFLSTQELEQEKQIEDIQTFVARSLRLLNTEFTTKFGNEILVLFNKLKIWTRDKAKAQYKQDAQNQALKVIKIGIEKYLWNTEKEAEILMEYRTTSRPTPITRYAYEKCKLHFSHIAEPSRRVELWLYEVFEKAAPSELIDFGNLLLFVNYAEYQKLKKADVAAARNRIIVEYLESVLMEIMKGVTTIFFQFNYVIDFPRDTNNHMELLIILKHLHRKITDTSQNLYLLLCCYHESTKALMTKYSAFSDFFLKKWASVFAEKTKNPKDPKEKIPSPEMVIKTNTSSKATKISDENNKAEDEKVISSPDDFSVESETIENSRLYQDRRVQPSMIRFYSAMKISWEGFTFDETNTNQMKVFLYELNGILTIIKHNVYILTAASRKKNKASLSWDSGYINGAKGPQTGMLDQPMELKKLPMTIPNEKEWKYFQSANAFIGEHEKYSNRATLDFD